MLFFFCKATFAENISKSFAGGKHSTYGFVSKVFSEVLTPGMHTSWHIVRNQRSSAAVATLVATLIV